MEISQFSNIIFQIGKYSFGIYVFHQWIIWNITRVPSILSQIQPLMIKYDIFFPLVLFIFIFILSFLLTKISVKTKIGKYLLT